MDKFEFEQELRKESLDEIEGYLFKISRILESLVIKDIDETVIHEIFRLVHSVKGSIKAIDLGKLATTTHHFEELLIKLRQKKLIYSEPIHDVCIKFCDQMDDAIKNLKIDFTNEATLYDLEEMIAAAIEPKKVAPIPTVIQRPIPLAPTAPPVHRKEPAVNDHEVEQTKTTFNILVAEDDPNIQEILGMALQDLPIKGIQVDFVLNGLEAFKKLYSNSYDFFIMDLNMPKMDGESLIEIWRRHLLPRHCPVLLVITGDEMFINALSLTDEGLFTLIKPFELNHLHRLLKFILNTIRLNNKK